MRDTRRYRVRPESFLAVILLLSFCSASTVHSQNRTHTAIYLASQDIPPIADESGTKFRTGSSLSSISKRARREVILEPTDEQRSMRPEARAEKGAFHETCTVLDIAGLTGSALIDFLVTHPADGCLSLFMFGFDEALSPVFSDANMQTVFLAIQERVPTYDGTYSGGLHQLWYYAHAAYYHEFFDAAVGPFTNVTRDHMISASRDFEANPHIYDQNDEAAEILGEWLIDLDNNGIREHFIAPIKRVLQNMTPERGSSIAQLWAYNTAFFFLFRGIANNDQGYMDALVADGEMTSILEAAARYEYLYPDNAYLIENAIAELSRLAEIQSFTQDVITALSSILPVYPRLSGPYLKAVVGLNQYGDCAQFGLCNIRDEVAALAFPNRFVFDDGAMVVETPLDLGVIQVLYHAAKQAQSQFFRLIESASPVQLDINETIVMRVYGSRDAYDTYQGFLYDLPTNNGGIYIESGATFYTYQRTPLESIYSLEELFRHEYIHYLAGRYIINGLFGQTDFYTDCRLTWFDEGMAEFLAGSTQGNGVEMRKRIAQMVSDDGTDRMTLDETIGACYGSGFTFYRYSSMFFSFLYEERREELKQIVDLIKSDDLSGYNALLADLKVDDVLESDYRTFNDQKIASIDELHDPSTSFPALVTLREYSEAELEPAFRALSGDLFAACSLDATEMNRRFNCRGEVSGTLLDAQDAGSANHYFNRVLDGWIESGDAHPVMNNFSGMNCHFVEITGSSGNPSTTYSCIGPLRNDNIALDSDQDGTPDSADDFPFNFLGWNDANANGILDPDEIPDQDADGLPDGFEAMFGFDMNDASDAHDDADSDLVDNLAEYEYGTNPLDANSTPPTVDLVGFLRNDSHDPRINAPNSMVIYANLRFDGDQATNTTLSYASSREVRIESVNLGGAACIQVSSTDFGGELDCGLLTNGSSGLDIFLNFTPLQACELAFSIEWESYEIELNPDDNRRELIFNVAGCPSETPPIPFVTATDNTFPDRVELSWDIASDTDYYEIYRGAEDDTTSAALLDTSSVGTYTDRSLVTPDIVYYWLSACNDLGCSPLSSSAAGSMTALSVSRESADDTLPAQFALLPNYPDPFHSSTTFLFELPKASYVTIRIYDMLGRSVATVIDKRLAAGRYEAPFDGAYLQSGAYLYRMRAGAFSKSRMMLLIK